MINWRVPPALCGPLEARVPRGTVLDSWRDRVFISLVGFRFLDTRLLGVPVPFHRHFDEINLRFYVRRETPEERRRGVVFVREIVPRRAIARVARWVYNEPYVRRKTMHHLSVPGAAEEAGRVEYAWWSSSGWQRFGVDVAGIPELPAEDSEETFITEHYWGYTAQRDGGTLEYRVEHPRWRVWQAEAVHLDWDPTADYGEELRRILTADPSSAFLAEGSEVAVFRGHRVEGGHP